MFFYLVLILFVVLVIFHIVTRYGRVGRLVSKIPAAYPTLPIIGSLLVFNPADSLGSWSLFRNLYKKYYPAMKLWSLTCPTVIIWDPEDIKILLTSKENLDKAYSYKYLHFAAGTGLITGGGEKWVQRRKLLSPAFHVDVMKKYLEVSNSHMKAFIEKMSKNPDNSVQNLSSLVSKLILTIVAETSIGVDREYFETKCEYYEGMVRRCFEIVHYRHFRPFLADWIFQFTPVGLQQRTLTKEIHEFTTKLIDERREYHQNTGYKFMEAENGTESEGGRKRFASLDLLLSLERKGLIDKSGILEEIVTFTVATHDTATTSMVFTLLLLAENEHAQDIARKEAIEVIDRSNGVLTVDNIKDLEYIERCLKEALRLFPPATIFGRSLTTDLQLKNHVIPAGIDVMVINFDLHRDPRFWKDPLKFDPDRFLPERMQEHYPYTYLPFSAGPRNCLGQKLAMITLKALIAYMLYNYRLEPITRSDEIKFKLSIVLAPSEPIYIRTIKL